MHGFYVGLDSYPQAVHELRDGEYPICGSGGTSQPIIRTERNVSCARCIKQMDEEELAQNHKTGLDPLRRPPYQYPW